VTAAILDLLLPPACPGCGQEGDLICPGCMPAFRRRLSEPPGAPIGLLVELPTGLLQLEWCASFTGPVRAALHVLKYDGERRLARPLGQLLAERWKRAGVSGELLVPVPIHAARLRERGFNQAALLAREAGRALRLPVVDVLVRGQETGAQHALGRGARAANVGRAFTVAPRSERTLAGRWVILVDDVTTTGATLAECAHALLSAGVSAVSGLTVARER
jgi:ComF family protein